MDYFVGCLIKDQKGSRAVRHVCNFQTLEAAIKAAKILVDDFLLANHQPGMTAIDLFSTYKNSGEVPVIFSDAGYTVCSGRFHASGIGKCPLSCAIERCRSAATGRL